MTLQSNEIVANKPEVYRLQQGKLQYDLLLLPCAGVLRVLPLCPFWNPAAKSALDMTMYLTEQPNLDQLQVRNLVEKGVLRLSFTFNLPESVLESLAQAFPKQEIRPAFIEEGELEIQDRSRKRDWQKVSGAGNKADYQFIINLNKEECSLIHQLLSEPRSPLHLRVALSYHDPITEKKKSYSATIPLSSLLSIYRKINSDQKTLNFRFFDYQQEAYLPLPKPYQTRISELPEARDLVVGARGGLQSTHLLIRPDLSYSSLAAVAVQPYFNRLLFINTVFQHNNAGNKIKPLPIINDPDALLWKDRKKSNWRWYLPEFVLEKPEPGTTFKESGFKFTFEKIGTNAQGDPVLQGTIEITIKLRRSVAVEEALEKLSGNIIAKPVVLSDTNFVLQIPFTNDQGEAVVTHIPTAHQNISFDEEGRAKLEFRLNNEWIRAAYGALSIEGYQNSEPAVIVSTSFQAYRKEHTNNFNLAAGTKITNVANEVDQPAAYAAPFLVNPQQRSIRFSGGELQPKTEKAFPRPKGNVPKPLPVLAPSVAMQTNRPPMIATASLQPTINLQYQPGSYKFSEHSVGVKKNITAVLSCTDYGAYYVEKATENAPLVSVGCREPYRIGQLPFRLYTKLNAYSDPHYEVWQSNQWGDRFLIVPKAYRITRKNATQDDAYRPAAILHTSVDAQNQENTVGLFDAQLEPDIPHYKRELLRLALRRERNTEPQFEYPTQLPIEATYQWLMPTEQEPSITTIPMGIGIYVSMRVQLADLMLFIKRLEVGWVNGSASLTLDDGTVFNIALDLDPHQVIGPWAEGPVVQARSHTDAALSNPMDNRLTIQEVHLINPDDTSEVRLVGTDLDKGESVTVDNIAADQHLIPIYQQAPLSGSSTIEETQIYIDDISREVYFMCIFDFVSEQVDSVEVFVKLNLPNADTKKLVLTSTRPSGSAILKVPITQYLTAETVLYRSVFHLNEHADESRTEWKEASIGMPINLPLISDLDAVLE